MLRKKSDKIDVWHLRIENKIADMVDAYMLKNNIQSNNLAIEQILFAFLHKDYSSSARNNAIINRTLNYRRHNSILRFSKSAMLQVKYDEQNLAEVLVIWKLKKIDQKKYAVTYIKHTLKKYKSFQDPEMKKYYIDIIQKLESTLNSTVLLDIYVRKIVRDYISWMRATTDKKMFRDMDDE